MSDTNSLARLEWPIDHVSVAPDRQTEMVNLTMTLTAQLEPAAALDLAMRLIGATARQQGLAEEQ